MSILPVFSKIFEKRVCEEITVFIDQILSKFQPNYRKPLDCLLSMLEQWKSEVDSEEGGLWESSTSSQKPFNTQKPLTVYRVS